MTLAPTNAVRITPGMAIPRKVDMERTSLTLTPEDRQMLALMCDIDGNIPASAMIRRLIRDEWKRRGMEKMGLAAKPSQGRPTVSTDRAA